MHKVPRHASETYDEGLVVVLKLLNTTVGGHSLTECKFVDHVVGNLAAELLVQGRADERLGDKPAADVNAER